MPSSRQITLRSPSRRFAKTSRNLFPSSKTADAEPQGLGIRLLEQVSPGLAVANRAHAAGGLIAAAAAPWFTRNQGQAEDRILWGELGCHKRLLHGWSPKEQNVAAGLGFSSSRGLRPDRPGVPPRYAVALLMSKRQAAACRTGKTMICNHLDLPVRPFPTHPMLRPCYGFCGLLYERCNTSMKR